jgi:hypothetical protein
MLTWLDHSHARANMCKWQPERSENNQRQPAPSADLSVTLRGVEHPLPAERVRGQALRLHHEAASDERSE